MAIKIDENDLRRISERLQLNERCEWRSFSSREEWHCQGKKVCKKHCGLADQVKQFPSFPSHKGGHALMVLKYWG